MTLRCCIVGAGAIGTHLAVKLAASGADVCVLARGDTLAAIGRDGLALETDHGVLHARVPASSDPNGLGPQDVVLVTTKATALRGLSAAIAPLVDEHTAVAFLQNGMAWWYPLGLPAGRPAPASLHVFGLADEYLRLLRPEQVLGGVVYSANAVVRPGLVRNNSPAKNAVELGCIDDLERPALLQARRALVQAGIESPPVADIRSALWLKLVGNAATSSLCVAIGNPAALLTDTALQQVYENLLRECLAVAAAHGHDVADRVGATNWTPHRARHKPSLLQDYEAGRPMEVEELLLAPVAFARAAGVATPTLDAVTAIAARLAIDKGLFRP